MMRLLSAASSHVGLVRRQNEDSFVVGGGIFAVCDGMGGARAGEVASEAACGSLIRLQEAGAVDPKSLERAVHEANADIVAQSRQDRGLQGMGTTMTAAVATPAGLAFVHVGDSRAYHLRDETLTQVTDDHSLVAEMVRRGQLSPAQAAVHPHRSIITRALGTEDTVKPDVFEIPLKPDDRVLFCSDGLSGMVPEDLIGRLLGRGDDPQVIADSLVEAALDNGGEDNVTVVVIVVARDDPPFAGSSGDATAQLGPMLRQPVAESGANASVGFGRGRMHSWFGSRRILVVAGVVVALFVVALVVFAVFNSTVYFVGTSAGSVTLFRGMPIAPLGVELYAAVEVSSTRYETLPPYQRTRVDAHELIGKDEGLRFVRGLGAGR